ncbi:MAG: type II toxin-antitoxin system Phd/YefM family antitoxin [Planctomycetes bacterium]|nr:type II toxin-antitoxin system Phd/YefM family antitoxin [Planctomycetota bacterium]
MEVKISELKARLSAYLHAVRRGATVTILDRKTRVALLVPLENGPGGIDVVPASRPPGAIAGIRGVRPRRAIDVVAILAETREAT